MRVVVAVEGWPEALPHHAPLADAVAATLSAWKGAAPTATVNAFAVGDGGPRSIDAFPGRRSRAGGCETVAVGGATWLAPAHGKMRWNPLNLSAALLGLAAAADDSTATLVVPVGDEPPEGDAVDVWGDSLAAVRAALSRVSILALVSTDRPLLGFHGMSAALTEGRESDEALAVAAQQQEARWRGIAREGDAVGERESLIGSTRLSDMPGSGAGVGLAYCLAALGARLMPAAPLVFTASSQSVAADSAAPGVATEDLIVAVVPRLTPRVLDFGLPAAVSAEAARRGVPAIVLTASMAVGKRDLMSAGIASAHTGDAGRGGLIDGMRRVAQTWARGH